MEIKLLSLFSGYGGAEFALKKANIPFGCVGFSEINKSAIVCYQQNHTGKYLGDITKINPEDVKDANVYTGGFPCQDLSISGKRDLSRGRSSLFNEIIRLAKANKPKYMVLENVTGILSMKYPTYGTYHNYVVNELKRIGYGVAWKVLNTKDYGIPQNRERVFYVCKYGDWDFMEFTFPEKETLKLKLVNLLESESDIKKYDNPDYFYITKKQLAAMKKHADRRARNLGSQINRDVAVCLTCGGDKRHLYDSNIIVHNLAPRCGDPKKGGQGHLQRDDNISYCLDTGKSEYIEYNGVSRILTPKERFRLMGFINDEINIDGLSYTACNNLSGNGWDINLVSKIMKRLFKS